MDYQDSKAADEAKNFFSALQGKRAYGEILSALKSDLSSFSMSRFDSVKDTSIAVVVCVCVGALSSLWFHYLVFAFVAVAITAMAYIIADTRAHLVSKKCRDRKHVLSSTISMISVFGVFSISAVSMWDTGYMSVFTALTLGIGLLIILASHSSDKGSRVIAALGCVAIVLMIVYIHKFVPQQAKESHTAATLIEKFCQPHIFIQFIILMGEAIVFVAVGRSVAEVVGFIHRAGDAIVDHMKTAQIEAERIDIKQHEYDFFINLLDTIQGLAGAGPEKQYGDLEISASLLASYDISGDFYDIQVHQPGGETVFWVGDVGGKGANAGIVMSSIQSCMRTLLMKNTDFTVDILDMLSDINKIVCHNFNDKIMDASFMATMTLMSYRDGIVRFTGEHENVILLKRDGGTTVINTTSYGMYLGIVEDLTIVSKVGSFSMEPGDKIVLYSDGIIEQVSRRTGIPVGFDTFRQICERHRYESVEDMQKNILEDFKVYVNLREPDKFSDDITLIVLGRNCGRPV